MSDPKVSEVDRYRCVFLAHYKIINDLTHTVILRNHEIDIDPDGPRVEDVRSRYRLPVISEGSPLTVRVYDESAVDLGRSNLLGDIADALHKCEKALEAEGYIVVHF